MKNETLKRPLLIFAITLVVAVVASLLTCISFAPAVKQQDFRYSLTYKLDGETKVVDLSYQCVFSEEEGEISRERYYVGEYADYGLALHSCSYTIAQKKDYDLVIVTNFNDAYLMGDTGSEYYNDEVEEPYLLVYDRDGVPNEDTALLEMFDAELVSWEYPEPVENSFKFVGFAPLHEGSLMLLMLIAALSLIACLILVKKEKDLAYGVLDYISIALNFLTLFVVFPLLTAVSMLIQAFPVGWDCLYGVYCCVPFLILFMLAVSLSLRRKGFKKSALFVQFVAPAVFAVLVILEYAA